MFSHLPIVVIISNSIQYCSINSLIIIIYIYIRPNPNRLVFSLKNAFRLSHKNSKKGENIVEKGKIPEFPWKKKSKNGRKCSLHFSRQNIRVSRCGHEQVHSIFSKIKEKVTQLRLSDCSELVKRTKFSVNKGQRIKSQSSGLKRPKICKNLRKRRKGDFSQKRPEKCEKKG